MENLYIINLKHLFKINTRNNKKIYITNLKMKNKNYRREKIDEILKNSKIISNNLDKHDNKTNKIFINIGIIS
jgi:hypothetical protein